MWCSSEYYGQFRVCYKTKSDNDTSPNTNKEVTATGLEPTTT